jgi:hypothetical protein
MYIFSGDNVLLTAYDTALGSFLLRERELLYYQGDIIHRGLPSVTISVTTSVFRELVSPDATTSGDSKVCNFVSGVKCIRGTGTWR